MVEQKLKSRQFQQVLENLDCFTDPSMSLLWINSSDSCFLFSILVDVVSLSPFFTQSSNSLQLSSGKIFLSKDIGDVAFLWRAYAQVENVDIYLEDEDRSGLYGFSVPIWTLSSADKHIQQNYANQGSVFLGTLQ